jgi:hypothetical protein
MFERARASYGAGMGKTEAAAWCQRYNGSGTGPGPGLPEPPEWPPYRRTLTGPDPLPVRSLLAPAPLPIVWLTVPACPDCNGSGRLPMGG